MRLHPSAYIIWVYAPFLHCLSLKEFLLRLLVLLFLFFLHLPCAVCLTVWLALFVLSDYSDYEDSLRMFPTGKCFQAFEMKSSKCYHFPYVCLLLDFTLLEDQFSRKSVEREIIIFSLKDWYSNQKREMRNSAFHTSSMRTVPKTVIFFSSYKPLIIKRIV